MEKLITEIKIGMLLTGSKDIKELKKSDYVVLGPLKEWLVSRGVYKW